MVVQVGSDPKLHDFTAFERENKHENYDGGGFIYLNFSLQLETVPNGYFTINILTDYHSLRDVISSGPHQYIIHLTMQEAIDKKDSFQSHFPGFF